MALHPGTSNSSKWYEMIIFGLSSTEILPEVRIHYKD
jgi:hypothetical protein